MVLEVPLAALQKPIVALQPVPLDVVAVMQLSLTTRKEKDSAMNSRGQLMGSSAKAATYAAATMGRKAKAPVGGGHAIESPPLYGGGAKSADVG